MTYNVLDLCHKANIPRTVGAPAADDSPDGLCGGFHRGGRGGGGCSDQQAPNTDSPVAGGSEARPLSGVGTPPRPIRFTLKLPVQLPRSCSRIS